MKIRPLRKDLVDYLVKWALLKRLNKQKKLFETDPYNTSLKTEILEPKSLRIYSFRITRNWRAIFVYIGRDTIEIIDINNHYK
ncbi:MAG: hypothetical protein HY452_01590 [Parcubacteria group bacterium]|nr:hypothetical protein [Parcubacteria group bacterium]